MKTICCYHCQHRWTYEPPLARNEECPACQKSCKVCLNCCHYDQHAYHECREPQAEWVRYKDEGNFCSYFLAREGGKQKGGETKGQQVAVALEALFRSDKGDTKAEAGPSKPTRLEDLFKK